MKNTKYAIDYRLAGDYENRTIVVLADDRDDAIDVARRMFVALRFYSASIQGIARAASQADMDAHNRPARLGDR